MTFFNETYRRLSAVDRPDYDDVLAWCNRYALGKYSIFARDDEQPWVIVEFDNDRLLAQAKLFWL